MRKFEGVWRPTQEDFDLFAEISGDNNPIHVDPDFSAKTRFGRTVSHGMLLYSKLWGLLQQNVPDAKQATQELMFPRPCYAGDVISLKIEETETNKFAIVATRQSNDENVLEGTMELA